MGDDNDSPLLGNKIIRVKDKVHLQWQCMKSIDELIDATLGAPTRAYNGPHKDAPTLIKIDKYNSINWRQIALPSLYTLSYMIIKIDKYNSINGRQMSLPSLYS